MDQEKEKQLDESLTRYSSEDFSFFVPKAMLNMSLEEIYTVQFAFWFCYIVEKDLDTALQESFRRMESVAGKTPVSELRFIKETYGIDFRKVDQTNPKYNSKDITFNDRIDIVEKIRGTSDHSEFLREIKEIRNALSYGRITDIKYKGKSLKDNEVKKNLVKDYIKQALSINSMEHEGGAMNQA
jgi:hypothetical protein